MLLIESGGPGGAEQVVTKLASALEKGSYEVIVVSFRRGWLSETIEGMGIRYLQLHTSSALDFTLAVRLALLLRREKIDILHSHLLDSNFYGSIAAWLARVGHVATEHGDVHHTNKKKYLKFKLKTASLLGSYFTAVSEFALNRLKELGVAKSRAFCIPNPAPDAPAVNAASRLQLRESLTGDNSEKTTFIWINVANLRPVKNQSCLLEAFAACQHSTTNKQVLLLVGDGPDKESLVLKATELGILGSVKFLGFRQDVAQLLAASDAFILSSQSESLPMSLLEAAAIGLPIVSTNVGGVEEIVKDQTSALLVPSNNAEALALAMSQVVKRSGYAKELGAEAKRQVQNKFSLEKVMSQYSLLYQQAL